MVGSAIAAELRATMDVVGIDRSNYDSFRGRRFRVLIDADGRSDKRAATRAPLEDFAANVETVARSLRDFAYDHYTLISSVDVYDDLSDRSRTSESMSPDPLRLSAYGLHKYVAELLVRRHVPRWTIFRLGPVVGPGLRKNAIFDLLAFAKLYVHPRSTYPYVDTRAVARIVRSLAERPGEIFNVCGHGEVELGDIARRLSIDLPAVDDRLPEEHYRIDVSKLAAAIEVPGSLETVLAFAGEWRAAGAAPTPIAGTR